MFDIGFSEIAVVGVVALVVLGPERLPKVARTAGHMFGRLQRYVATVKSDINREMDASEFSKLKEEVTSAAKSFEQTMNEQTSAFKAETAAIEKSATPELPSDIAKADIAKTQTELLAEQESGIPAPITSAPSSPAPQMLAKPSTSASAFQPQLQTFDLGIEPPRKKSPQTV
jgi:sec-independent protein translocase protein TatB